ncbi:cytochrome c biogenesis factor [Nostoc sp. PCC 7524]|uniref:tetratricopeptide repeat protein n=1 Tax=Nostoc sp. (strain ATCC 29411 / PCC 7524) TaxID=28072 RepID=UPI00029F3E80|nr:tetratricopeptide repeat protein [Nostoc sp. PCC 7524]AFY46979.1 cytochrome c biogenesis factor [Nostoc sp. PCC 7524]
MKIHQAFQCFLPLASIAINLLTLLAIDLPAFSFTPSLDYSLSSQDWMQKYSTRSIQQLGSVTPQRQLYIYETIQYHAYALWASLDQRILLEVKSKLGSSDTVLTLMDNNHDGKPDEWIHHPSGDYDSPDFGFMFDLNQDGKMDYFVFNGGPLFVKEETQNADKIFPGLFWMNYHWIDSNYDGHIDIMVFNDIDLDGDGYPDQGITAWVYDDDFDGRVDRTEYLGYTPWFPMNTQYGQLWKPEKNQPLKKPVEPKEGEFIIQRSVKNINPRVFNKQFDIRKTELVSEINSVVSKLPVSKGINSSEAAIYFNLGMALFYEEKWQEASTAFQNVISLDIQHTKSYFMRGRANLYLKNYAEAIQDYRQVIKLEPNNDEAHYLLGYTLTRTNNLEEAIAAYRQTIKLNPRHAHAYNNLGSIFGRQGRYNEAIQVLQQSIQLDPKNTPAYFNLGRALYETGRYEQAVEYFRQALKLEPNYSSAQEYLERTLQRLGRDQ